MKLEWAACRARDFGHFSVYAGEGRFEPGNATVIRSLGGTSIVDGGLPSGKAVTYKVVAYDDRLNASAPAAVRVTPDRNVATRSFPAEDLLSEGMEKVPAGARTFVRAKSGAGRIDIPVDVPQGTYRLWIDQTTLRVTAPRLSVAFDGKPLGSMRVHQHRSVGGPRSFSPGKVTVFSDVLRFSPEKDRIEIGKGKHVLTLTWKSKDLLVDTLHLTSDPQFRPEDYNPFVRMDTRRAGWRER